MSNRPVVGVVRCDATASDEAVVEKLAEAASHLGDLGALFAGKRKVFIKPNIGTSEVRLHEGRQISLTDKSVLLATVALIRKYYSGEIVIGDDTTTRDASLLEVYKRVGHDVALARYDVRVAKLQQPPYVEFTVPGGNHVMFSKYLFSSELADVDAFVSVAKMKSHVSAGATLTMKNLFGLPPKEVYGAPRRYLHAPVRLPRVLADCGQIFNPVLNVVDGLISGDEREWGGPPIKSDVMLIGTNCVATDATGMRLMGMDPTLDYDQFPFLWERNPLKLASEAGLGPIEAEEIDVKGEVPDAPIYSFHVDRIGSADTDLVRRGVAGQALVYLEKRSELLRTSLGKIVAVAGGEVISTVNTVNEIPRRAQLAGTVTGAPTVGVFLKQVLPPEEEPERMEVYQQVLDGKA